MKLKNVPWWVWAIGGYVGLQYLQGGRVGGALQSLGAAPLTLTWTKDGNNYVIRASRAAQLVVRGPLGEMYDSGGLQTTWAFNPSGGVGLYQVHAVTADGATATASYQGES